MDNLNKVLDKTNSTKKSVPKIPKKLKEGLMKKLHVSGEDIEATLSVNIVSEIYHFTFSHFKKSIFLVILSS